ncbi:hypothetical protein sS8_0121 [Methylocaldum marinum]|uniref:Uncharacterized protein n=1 Tax=Methylocaldum marinum TaxID=1432792 RepID=A0A286P368_9GAMM|nr:hypothetical protein sS8_0121 [Methylocaldum marinum]
MELGGCTIVRYSTAFSPRHAFRKDAGPSRPPGSARTIPGFAIAAGNRPVEQACGSKTRLAAAGPGRTKLAYSMPMLSE